MDRSGGRPGPPSGDWPECGKLFHVDDAVARLEADGAVRAFVDEALRCLEGAPEGVARLMQLRLSEGRPEDARVLELVIAEAVRLAEVEHVARVAAVRSRAIALCDRSQALIARRSLLRTWTADAFAAFHARVGPGRGATARGEAARGGARGEARPRRRVGHLRSARR